MKLIIALLFFSTAAMASHECTCGEIEEYQMCAGENTHKRILETCKREFDSNDEIIKLLMCNTIMLKRCSKECFHYASAFMCTKPIYYTDRAMKPGEGVLKKEEADE